MKRIHFILFLINQFQVLIKRYFFGFKNKFKFNQKFFVVFLSFNVQKKSQQTDSDLNEEEIKPIESQIKTIQELNSQLNESFRNISLNKDRKDYSSKRVEQLEQDRVSVQSQMSQVSQISFQDELSATLTRRKAVVKNSIIRTPGLHPIL